MQLLEQVWHLDDYSKIDVRKWTYYTAQSNFLVAIDKEALYPFARKVQSAERAEAMYKLLGEAFDEKRLVSQYFIINAIDDACDPRRRSAVERFKETDLATKDVAEFDELKDQISQLLIDNPDC